jgi:hydrogenase maturation protein HypF
VASGRAGTPAALVAADSATWDACLSEVSTPPIAATATRSRTARTAGRFTIVLGVPYDRECTTMHAFAMCAA